ncbi:MAG: GNAT family N-acetyltransferase [Pseudomonadota bacterium]
MALNALNEDEPAVDPRDVALLPAGREALPVLVELYNQMLAAHGDSMAADAICEKLGKGLDAGQRATLFRHARRTVGFVVWADLGDHVFIRNFLIDEDLRRQGLGRTLFERFRTECLAPGTPLRLEASADHALRFWEAMGFAAWSTGMRLDPPQEPAR